jgi:hypothetical protein
VCSSDLHYHFPCHDADRDPPIAGGGRGFIPRQVELEVFYNRFLDFDPKILRLNFISLQFIVIFFMGVHIAIRSRVLNAHSCFGGELI